MPDRPLSWTLATSVYGRHGLPPDYPPYNDYSFTIGFNNDLYDSNTDDLRIRLYEEPTDSTPYLAIFDPGQIAANVFTSPTYVKQTQASGTLWYDYTGKMEVEVLSGSVQLDYVWIQLGPGGGSFTGQIDAVPEPNASISFCSWSMWNIFLQKTKTSNQGHGRDGVRQLN